MRYAVFSDVHANSEAFQAVLDFFHSSSVDRYVFLGDIVGYGADPEACLSLLKDTAALSVAGNHDWAAVGRFGTDYFNQAAKAAVVWTSQRLGEADKAFLAGLALVKEEQNHFCLVHGTLEDPGQFDYMMDGSRARRTFELLKTPVCFV